MNLKAKFVVSLGFVGLLSLLPGLTVTVYADSYNAIANAGVSGVTSSPSSNTCNMNNSAFNGGTATSSCSLVDPAPSAADATSSVIAGPNNLGVLASVDASSSGFSPSATGAGGEATLTDELLLSNAPASGYLDFVMSLVGSSTSEFQQAYAIVDMTTQGLNANGNLVPNGSYGSGLLYTGQDLDVPLAYSGSDIYFTLSLVVDAACEAEPNESCSATAAFFDTLQIASITVEDSNQNAVTGATPVSASGVDYSIPPPTAMPEPSSLFLLCIGLLGLGLFAFSRKRCAQFADAAVL